MKKLPKILKSVKSIHYYSLLIRVLSGEGRGAGERPRLRRGELQAEVGLLGRGRRRRRSATRRPIGKISAKCCSFSAVSAPIFASNYAFFSIFQNLPHYLADIFEIGQMFANFAIIAFFC